MDPFRQFQKEVELYEGKKAKLFKDIQSQFPKLLKEIFKKHPWAESVSWTQYTPYFNDGDECVFSANIDWVRINEVDVDDLTDGELVEKEKAFEDFVKFLNIVPQEFYKEAFGDHCEVTIFKDGSSEVDECSHD